MLNNNPSSLNKKKIVEAKKINLLTLLFFLLLVFFLRLSSFFQSAIGWDESLYLLMAKSLTEGHWLYTEIWDNKPPGIYLLFSLALLIFGKSIISIRIATSIAVFITSYLLYKIGNKVSKNNTKVGLIAGTLYAFLSLKNGGIESNTELFYSCFVVFAFYLLFSVVIDLAKPISQNYSKLFMIGLSMGIGLQIKQVVLFDFIAILTIIGVHLYYTALHHKRDVFKKILNCYVLLGVGFIIPFAITLLYFIIGGHFQDYLYANFYANAIRVGSEKFSLANFETGFLIQFHSYLILWICLLLTPFYWLSSKEVTSEEKRILSYILIWLSMAFLGVCSGKLFYSYYFLQILPSLCILGSYTIIKMVWSVPGRNAAKNFAILALILVTPLFSNAYPYIRLGLKSAYYQYVKGISNWGDDVATISQYLQERVTQKDYIYVADDLSIYYFLVKAKIPTKYAYTPFMTYRNLPQVAGIDPVKELHSIMRKKPVYVIRVKLNRLTTESKEKTFYSELDRFLKSNYVFEKDFKTKRDAFEGSKFELDKIIELYRLKSK